MINKTDINLFLVRVSEYIKVRSLIEHLPCIKTCFTGQHKDLLNNIVVDYNIDILDDKCTNRLNCVVINILTHSYIFDESDYVLIQGDTISACAIAISAFNHKKKVIHLEAGLRSGNANDPFPEEMNRQIISRIAAIHLCATENNRQNLLMENVAGQIFVVGQTGLDNITRDSCEYSNKILITLHRSDNMMIMHKWFEKIEQLATEYSHLEFMIPLHPNPGVQKHRNIFKKVRIVQPMSHANLIDYVKKCKFVISDSGGLQEECSYLNKKIIVCRRTTERPETIGTHSIMCAFPDQLQQVFESVYNDYHIDKICPYGNGESWKNIVDIIKLMN